MLKKIIVLLLMSLSSFSLCSFKQLDDGKSMLDQKINDSYIENEKYSPRAILSKIKFDNKTYIDNGVYISSEKANIKNCIITNSNCTLFIFYNLDLKVFGQHCIIVDNLGNKYNFTEQYFINDAEIKDSIKSFIVDTIFKLNSNYANASVYTEPTISKKNNIYTLNFGRLAYINVSIDYTIKKVNEKSSIVLFQPKVEFTPGAVANKKPELSGQFDNYHNSDGTIDIGILKAYDSSESYAYPYRYGSEVFYLDSWPTSDNRVVILKSHIDANVELGKSQEDGLYIDGGLSIAYDKAILQKDPLVSHSTYHQNMIQLNDQYKTEEENKYIYSTSMWNYNYSELATLSFEQVCNYMFEIGNDKRDLFLHDYRTLMNFNFSVDKGMWWPRQHLKGTLDLYISPSQNLITNFNSGMLN